MARRRIRALAVALLIAAGLTPSPALAWKVNTHLYLALEVLRDALDDGKVTVWRVNHTDGTRVGPPIELPVEPRILAALRANPVAYLVGVIGPDSYPDMLTGQMLVHPPGLEPQPPSPGTRDPSGGPDVNTRGPGSNPWMEAIWRAAWVDEPSPTNQAFALGYLTHAAGDIFAHTWVNFYAGGIFDTFGDSDTPLGNAARHMVLEGYVGQRTPDLGTIVVDGRSVDVYEAVVDLGLGDGLDGFIARHASTLDGSDDDGNALYSFPHWANLLRRGVVELSARAEMEEQRRRANAAQRGRELAVHLVQIARACVPFNAGPCPDLTSPPDRCPAEYGGSDAAMCLALPLSTPFYLEPATRATVEWSAFVVPLLVARGHFQRWLASIDAGMIDWVHVGHDTGTELFLRPTGINVDGVTAVLEAFKPTILTMVTGLPNEVSDIIRILDQANLLKLSLDALNELHGASHDRHFKLMFGMTRQEFRDRFLEPHSFIDNIFASNPSLGLEPLNRTIADREMGVDSQGDRGPVPVVRFETQRFRPAANTVTLSKLALVAPERIDALMEELVGHPGDFAPAPVGGAPGNVMLGFVRAIDGSNQWAYPSPRLVLARDCNAFRQIFVAQAGFTGTPPIHMRGDYARAIWEPVTDLCKTPAQVTLTASATWTSDIGQPLTVTASERARWSASLGTLQPDAAGLTATYRPPVTGRAVDVVLEARAIDGNRRATVTVRLLPRVSIEVGGPSTDPRETAPVGLEIGPGDVRVLHAREGFDDLVADWKVVSGPGTLRPVGDARLVAGPAAATRERMGRLVSSRTTELARRRACRDVACRASADRALTDLARQLHAELVADAEARLAASVRAATIEYVAPATLAVATEVVIRAASRDSSRRSSEVRFSIVPRPPALRATASPNALGPGQSVEIVIDPPVRVVWKVEGAGAIGAPAKEAEAARAAAVRELEAELKTTGSGAKGPGVLAPRVGAPPTGDKRVATDAVARRKEALAAAARAVASARNTYVAPAAITKPTDVTLSGVAADGSGRTVEVKLRLTPPR